MNGISESVPASSAAYQRKRLWCGISGIGLVLVGLWAGWALGLPGLLDRWFHWKGLAGGAAAGAAAAAVLGLLTVVLQSPLDFVAMGVEREFGQVAAGTRFNLPGVYLRRTLEWLGGVAVAGAVLGGCYAIGGKFWPLAAMGGLCVLAFAHIVWPVKPGPVLPLPPEKRAWWDEVVKELKRTGVFVPDAVWYSHGERSLAGGWNGVGPLRKLFMTRTVWELSPRMVVGLIAREQGHLELGHRWASMAVSAVWVCAGVLIASRLTEQHGAAGAVAITATVMSTWCWVGLLGLLPWLGRRQVLEADAFLLDLEFTKEEVAEMFGELSRRNKPDETLPAGIAAIFHPIPPMAERRRRLGV